MAGAFFAPAVFPAQDVKNGSDKKIEAAQKNRLPDTPYTLVLKGNSSFPDNELLKMAAAEIQAFKQKGFRKADIDDAAYQMRSAYLQAGFAFASVDYAYEKTADSLRVTFEISEGPQVRIGSLVFTGNSHAAADTLTGLIAGKNEADTAHDRKLYVQSSLKDGRNRIRDYYRAEGYADVIVDEPSLHFTDSRSEVDVTLNIREGIRYQIGEILFTGDIRPGLSAELDGIRKDLLGKPYFARRKLLLNSRVKEAYDNLGYADADIDIRAGHPDGSGKVVLEAGIASGRPVRISEVVITGNRKTRDSFIRNRLQLKPGDLYSNTAKRESFRNLFDTGLFAEIDLKLSQPEDDGERNLQVNVAELPTRELYVEPGWGSYEQLRLGVGAFEKNLLGTGRNARIEGLISSKGETVTLIYTDPWLLRTAVSMSVPLSYERREEPSYTSKATQLSLLFSKKMTADFNVSASYSYSRTETSDQPDQPVVIADDDRYQKGAIGLQAVWDTRDDIFYPRKGLRLATGMDLATPAIGSDLNFGRLTFGCRYFIELPETFILGLRMTSGLIVPLGSQISIPLTERFFNGGDNTVRSYKHSQLGPKDDAGEPVGGLGYNVFTIELRKRFYQKFVAAVYADAGNISPNLSLRHRNLTPYADRTELLDDTLADFWQDFKFGIGAGLMYLLPVGPARIDFAYNPSPEKTWDEDSWVFHFSLGLAF